MSAETNTPGVWIEVPKWVPSTILPTVRHSINNILSPMLLASELIVDDARQTDPERFDQTPAALLEIAVERARTVNDRLGWLIGRDGCKLVTVPGDDVIKFVRNLAGSSAPSAFDHDGEHDTGHGTVHDGDVTTLVDWGCLERIVTEMLANDAVVDARWDRRRVVILGVHDKPPVQHTKIALAGVPFACGGLGLPIICGAAWDQGATVRIRVDKAETLVTLPRAR